jgi:hypothetical protein
MANGQIIDLATVRAAREAAQAVAADLQAALFAVVLPVPEAPVAPFVPAYADPENETRGAKYDRRLSTREIAALVRAEIKAATGKTIPKSTKVSVRSESFSGGSAIRLTVTAVPAGFGICNPERVVRQAAEPHRHIDAVHCPYFTAEAEALLETITNLCQAYNRNNSDSSSDYFDVNFYGGHAQFSYELQNASRDAILSSREVAS